MQIDELPAGEQNQCPDMDMNRVESVTILKDASFRFEKGKKYALIGPSGCGKSTLLKILLGWLPEYQGTIRFDGRDIREYTPEQLQQQMSYIEQNVFLFNASIRENITLDEDFTEEQLSDNFQTLMGAINKAKPSSLKGQYIKSATITSTMGPGVKLNVVKIAQ